MPLVKWGGNVLRSPFTLGKVQHVRYGHGLAHHVEAPEAGVRVARVEGLEAVAEAALACHLSQLTGEVLGGEDACQPVEKSTMEVGLRGTATHHTPTKGAVPVADECVGHHQGDGVRV